MSASSTVFTHVVLTAPAQAIADVYKVQLQALGESLPFLRGAVVECFPDPVGHRVGSGGGTLNALRCLQEKYNISSFASARVLLIHSGGESRRAPLYSLIGKAWTTVNCTLEGGDIACPLTLLIKEITIFCANLPEGSVVVASSDVMLNIAGPHCSSLKFADNSVCLVTVPETPTTAKNHGVLVLADVSDAGAGCSVGDAVKYMQKPTLEELQSAGALYDATDSTSSKDSFALVDTGVVIFTGSATHALEMLLSDSAMANCTLRGLDSGDNSNRPLRLELYTEVLLALAFGNQTDFDISVYHKRLGLDRHQLHSEVDEQYLRALTVLWDTLKDVPLTAVFVPTGAFEHLGTTAVLPSLVFSFTLARRSLHRTSSTNVWPKFTARCKAVIAKCGSAQLRSTVGCESNKLVTST
jgi:fucokinase